MATVNREEAQSAFMMMPGGSGPLPPCFVIVSEMRSGSTALVAELAPTPAQIEWQEMRDKEGNVYYYNHQTKEATTADLVTASSSLHQQWIVTSSSLHVAPYYHNHHTKEATWARPATCVAAAASDPSAPERPSRMSAHV